MNISVIEQKAYDKIAACIDSCSTVEQLAISARMLELHGILYREFTGHRTQMQCRLQSRRLDVKYQSAITHTLN